MDEPIGRREANKRATRAALQTAARALFDERGFDATSVREIAERAGVGERTFYRYFETKEALIEDDVDRWLQALGEAIRVQPAVLGPFGAVHAALVQLAGEIAAGAREPPVWSIGEGADPYAILQRAGPRPLWRVEKAIADALFARGESGAEPVSYLRAEIIARVAVAIMRGVVIRRRELELAGDAPVPSLAELAAEAIGELRAVVGTGR